MAEETDLSRTEPASPRRLQQARSAGDVPRSAELTAWVVLLSALGMLGWLAPRLLKALQVLTEAAFSHAAEPLSPVFLQAVWAALWAVLPVLAVIFAAALVAPILLSGWVFAPHIVQADLTRASPFKPVARLFSVDSLFDGSLMLLKLALAATAVGWVLATAQLRPYFGVDLGFARLGQHFLPGHRMAAQITPPAPAGIHHSRQRQHRRQHQHAASHPGSRRVQRNAHFAARQALQPRPAARQNPADGSGGKCQFQQHQRPVEQGVDGK